jgi:hypothetical protein
MIYNENKFKSNPLFDEEEIKNDFMTFHPNEVSQMHLDEIILPTMPE